ncbi:transposase [Streptomyces sp. NPDC093149]|uniref:transposase n=1 Tax=Streptomyces sp. NPDC093149 TaxID=3366031 RepID=UPI003817296E
MRTSLRLAMHRIRRRALYLPKSWTGNEECRAQAAVPDESGFATKPHLAQQMIERALDAGAPAAWAAGDEVYGDNPKLRAALEARQLGYVLANAARRRSRRRVAAMGYGTALDSGTGLRPSHPVARQLLRRGCSCVSGRPRGVLGGRPASPVWR